MSAVRIRFWLKNGEFLDTSIDIDDLIAINEVYGKVKAGVIRNENLKITISNITFHVDDIAKASCWYGYLFTDEPLSTVTIEERDVIKEELNKVYGKVDNFIERIEEKFLITILVITLIIATLVTACQILGG
jgi:hypothetical protein